MTQLGSNSGFAAKELVKLVERIERLEEEKAVLTSDIQEIYGEAKSAGFDNKILRRVIALRKLDAGKRKEMEAVLELYMAALDHADAKATERSYAEGAE